MAIDAVSAARGPGPAPRGKPRTGVGFQVPAGATPAPPLAGVALSGMLALQEIDTPAERDRAARRRGQRLLSELAALQRAVLAGDGALPAALARLGELVQAVPPAADPALRQAVAAIVLRSRVELARYRHDNAKFAAPPRR